MLAARAAATTEMQVKLGCGRPRLVMDPWLCLEPRGALLIQRLQALSEIWIARELWHILDNSHYFALNPRALVSGEQPSMAEYRALFAGAPPSLSDEAGAARSLAAGPRGSELAHTLALWDCIRSATDLSGLKLFWVGDGLGESLLPDGSPPSVHVRHEQLAQWLDRALAPRSPVACAQRDALALALALGGVPVLSLLDAEREALTLPGWLGAGAVRCTEVPASDAFLALEREAWSSLLVRANCAPLVWSGLRLAILHVHAAPTLAFAGASEAAGDTDEPLPPASAAPEQVQAYWYAL